MPAPRAVPVSGSAPRPAARGVAALLLSCVLLLTTAACGGGDDTQSVSAAAVTPTSTGTFEQQKLAKTRFVANAGLAAGAAYQWIVKPYRAGKFTKGADGRTFALVKAGLAGAFTYNRLKAAVNNAKGDPLLSKAVVPLTAGIESLKDLGTKLRKGEVGAADVGAFESVINSVKDAGKSAGAEVVDKVPSAAQLAG
ncbi:hypothetical protein [Streptomyces sp. NBC_00094]|uniref:hypothetical protein n=1 Tax=Streptomyces sp. NBC_00094 TaxID=2903620 RepID=UPI0022547036|nr:hypothetical protein [Streptomyces sp. NBC_00094]MCX5390397.1 hypothetical protein [Streptomyces sp. NBC_00094]